MSTTLNAPWKNAKRTFSASASAASQLPAQRTPAEASSTVWSFFFCQDVDFKDTGTDGLIDTPWHFTPGVLERSVLRSAEGRRVV